MNTNIFLLDCSKRRVIYLISLFYPLSLGFSEEIQSSYGFDAQNDNNDKASSDDDDWPGARDGYPPSGLENVGNVQVLGPVIDPKILQQYQLELKAGDPADLLGTNQHHFQASEYPDFERRFVPQYPYTEKQMKVKNGEERLLPKLAPPEIVLSVAKESALLEAAKPINPTDDIIRKDILRTGEYWNGVWKEDVNPEKLLRSYNKNPALKVLNVNIKPGSELYEFAMKLKRISPRLLYIINKDK